MFDFLMLDTNWSKIEIADINPGGSKDLLDSLEYIETIYGSEMKGYLFISIVVNRVEQRLYQQDIWNIIACIERWKSLLSGEQPHFEEYYLPHRT